MRIVFLGTPEFAVASLAALVEAGMEVVAVVTSPDKPAGRGLQLRSSAVKQYAVSKNIPVLQPEKLKDPVFLGALASYKADIQVVVAFRMLPQEVWNMPPLGTINVHASLLPQYRGAAPINHAIMNGETITGVTTFRLQHEIDTGGILLQKETEILPTDNAGSLHDKLMYLGATLIVETIQGIAKGVLKERPQVVPEGGIRYAPKIFTQHREIHWENSGTTILNQIRGLSPYPTAFTSLQGKMLKIFQARFEQTHPHIAAGQYESDGKNMLRYAVKDGWIYVEELQMEGKKKMPVTEFLKGFRPDKT